MHGTSPESNPEFEKVCAILESVASNYAPESEEARAIQAAAEAYIYVQLHVGLNQAYQRFKRMGLDGLTDVQSQILRDMGIEPEDD
ncbi:MAG TPA: hypothetical protein VG406_12090 [Isosphaeraceae bacterium]|jgi:hypothetical protein|nr:hypothetical protein [Isosphaeraceae bacterium]